MRRAVASRAVVLALTALLVGALTAFADVVPGDADTVAAGNQASRDLGNVGPGQVLTVPVAFSLACKGTQHVDAGQTITLALDSSTVPLDGAASSTDATIGPVPSDWPVDGTFCPAPPPIPSTVATVTLTAPTTVGGPYTYSLMYSRTLSPAGSGDDLSLTSLSAVSFKLTVVPNTPPKLDLPADSTIEGNTTGGAKAAYTVSASDAEDSPPPTPSCDPASGSLLPLGDNTINCSVTDSGGMSASGSFHITVVDTTAPTLSSVPGSISVSTTDAAGTAVFWPSPAAADIVDPTPSVGCLPAPGSSFPVGTTQVTCTASDASGNSSSASFDVTVDLVAPALSAVFGSPIGPSGQVTVNPGRTLPVKVTIWRDGAAQSTGSAVLWLRPCGSTAPTAAPTISQTLRWLPDAGPWFGLLDTSGLTAGSCEQGTVTLDGQPAGTFTMHVVRGSGH